MINDEDMRKFLARAVKAETARQKDGAVAAAGAEGGGFTLSVLNPATQHGRRGLRVLQQIHTMRMSTLTVHDPDPADASLVVVTTRNVRRLSFRCGGHGGGSGGFGSSPSRIRIDAAESLALSSGCQHFCLAADGSSWEDCTATASTYSKLERSPLTYGPARQVFMAPFAIVVGTGGSAEENAALLEVGRYISVSHFAAVSSYAPVLLDSHIADWGGEERNLVLLGRPEVNAATAWLQRAAADGATAAPPVAFLPRGYRVGDCAHTGSGTAIGFVAPLPPGPPHFAYSVGGAEAGRLALVLDGATPEALRSLVRFSFSSNQALTRAAFTNLWPDYLVRPLDREFSRLDRDATRTPQCWLTDSRFGAGGRRGVRGARVWRRAGGRLLGGWVGEERRDVL